jgi:hypothetical protein
VQVLRGFPNCYRGLIWKNAKTRDAELTFRNLNKAFTEAVILQRFNPQKPIILQTDARGCVIAGILNQYDKFGIPRIVNFYSQKCSPAEQNYDTYDRELLAIIETMKQWRHYLEGANHKVLIQCDNKNLEYFQTSKVLSRRQARCAEILSSYYFVIEHLDGKDNPGEGPTRRPGYEIGYEWPTARLLAPLTATTIEPYDALLQEIKAAQAIEALAAEVKHRIVSSNRRYP